MQLKSIQADGFKLLDGFYFEFPQEPGLYLLTGENLDRPELGSNGVAKSSLWDAVCFALGAQSARGLKGPELVTDGLDEIHIQLNTDGGFIDRHWYPAKKNSLKLNGVEVAQEEVSRTFSFDRETFIATTVIPQRTPLFVDLPPTSQVQVLQRLLDMERWLKYADRASKKIAGFEAERADILLKIATIQGELKGIDLNQAEEDIKAWAHRNAEDIGVYERDIARYQEAIDKLNSEPDTLKADLPALESRAKRAESNLSVLKRRLDEINTELGGLDAQQRADRNRAVELRRAASAPSCVDIRGEINSLKVQRDQAAYEKKQDPKAARDHRASSSSYAAAIKLVEKDKAFYNENPTCPSCKQPIGPEFKDECFLEFDKKIKELRDAGATADQEADFLVVAHQAACDKQIQLLEGKISAKDTELTAAQEAFDRSRAEEANALDAACNARETRRTELGKEKEATQAQERSAQTSLVEARGRVQYVGSRRKDIEYTQASNINNQNAMKAKLQAHKDAVNPFIDRLEQLKARQAQIGVDIDESHSKAAIATGAIEGYKEWQKGFRAIRSQLISDSLHQFGLEIAGVQEDLGLIGWTITPMIDPNVFDSVRTQTGFKFMVVDPDGVERVLDAFSGGELQRVALAIQLGLGALIASQQAAQWDFEVWDEPSTYMSEEGILGLFRSLKDRAERLKKVIWVIDHHQVHYGEVTKVYRLIRQNNRVTVE